MNRFILIAMTLLSLLCVSPKAAAQEKGTMVLGVSGGYASHNNSGFADIYFQYSFSRHVRIAPELGYIFKNEGKSGFEASIDMHFPFRVAKGFSLYPLAGVTFNNWYYTKADDNITRCGADFGAGMDLCLTPHLKITLQGKYSLMKDTDGAFVSLGLGYIF